MNIIFTIIVAPLIGAFIKNRPLAIAIYLAVESILFTFQSIAVLLAWMGADGGFGGATENGAFGPTPTVFPIVYDTAQLLMYGLVNVLIIGAGIGLLVGVSALRARAARKRSAVSVV